ncbi:MAG: phosphoribosylglycinamide formyltransferase [Candidatus Marinimicrobia bacterium]|nr:phosphoribosylglycinamide formyltransferase [Candidatus Neomarinimicrobiota bacterium]MDP6965702.1 phosphoribosylglycinamide formyltransferase [Candidatus Neomarinimicrobiota bacterium]
MANSIKLGVLGSTKGTDLQAISDAIHRGDLDASVEVVISNRKKAYILERARNHGIEAVFISHKGKEREQFDREMTDVLEAKGVELVLLIGFMRILSPWFCRHWRNRVLNVHPSLLPKYAGGMDMNVHEEVLKNGETETGCTIHIVTAEVDAGPHVIQKRCSIEAEDTPETLKEKVQALEGKAFLESIRIFQNSEGPWSNQ